MMVPASKLSEDPLLSTSETVPDVVGVHLRSNDVPPVALSPPLGMLNGLGLAARASRGEDSSAMSAAFEYCILAVM